TKAELADLLGRLGSDEVFRRLKPSTRLAIYEALIAFGNARNEWWITQAKWASIAGLSVSTIKKVVAETEGSGLIEVIEQRADSGPGRGRKAPTHYILHPRFSYTGSHDLQLHGYPTSSYIVKQEQELTINGDSGYTGNHSSPTSPTKP